MQINKNAFFRSALAQSRDVHRRSGFFGEHSDEEASFKTSTMVAYGSFRIFLVGVCLASQRYGRHAMVDGRLEFGAVQTPRARARHTQTVTETHRQTLTKMHTLIHIRQHTHADTRQHTPKRGVALREMRSGVRHDTRRYHTSPHERNEELLSWTSIQTRHVKLLWLQTALRTVDGLGHLASTWQRSVAT